MHALVWPHDDRRKGMTARDPAAPVHSLEARYYTDPAIFGKERTGLLSRTWQFAGHESLVRNAGDYFAVEIAGESLFCVRGRDGNLRSFYNVCQHRAHRLLQDAGRVRAVVCPYHAWSYELDGAFRSGPNVASVPGFDASAIRLTPVRTETFHGFVFVNLDDDAAPMDAWYPRRARGTGDVRAGHRRAGAARMDRSARKVQLEGLGRELLRVLPLHPQPPGVRDRRRPARELRHSGFGAGIRPAPRLGVPGR